MLRRSTRRCAHSIANSSDGPVVTSGTTNGAVPTQRRQTTSMDSHYQLQSSLPVDFFKMLHTKFGVEYFHPIILGLRTNDMRGIFLPTGHKIPRNQVIAAIPLKNVLSNDALMAEDIAIKELTVDRVRAAVGTDEMKAMAPQLHLGIQTACIAHNLPDRTKCHTLEEMASCDEVLRRGIIPWIRMIDDENYSQEWIDATYAQRGLDNLQSKSYRELTELMKTTTTKLHAELQLPCTIDSMRRHIRIVIARTDALTPASYYDKPRFVRRLLSLKRRIYGERPPLTPCIVPLADMLNHSNRPNVTTRIELNSKHLDGRHAVVVQSLRDISGGEELCRHYNFAMSRDAALFRYGFLPYELFTIQENNFYESHIESQRNDFSLPKAKAIAEREREVQERVHELEQVFRGQRTPNHQAPK